jgi:hypothetical protein
MKLILMLLTLLNLNVFYYVDLQAVGLLLTWVMIFDHVPMTGDSDFLLIVS